MTEEIEWSEDDDACRSIKKRRWCMPNHKTVQLNLPNQALGECITPCRALQRRMKVIHPITLSLSSKPGRFLRVDFLMEITRQDWKWGRKEAQQNKYWRRKKRSLHNKHHVSVYQQQGKLYSFQQTHHDRSKGGRQRSGQWRQQKVVGSGDCYHVVREKWRSV